jgi:ribosomal protein L11 methyltransferase
MYLWQRTASQNWWSDHEEHVRALAGNQLAIIEQPGREQLQLEVACRSQTRAKKLASDFDGRVKKLPADWLKRFLRRKTKPLKLGNRQLIIPAGAAFGTGEHATTAMSLRLLEELTRNWKRGWSIVDLGTGSGILALAAKHLGAAHVLGIDNDPVAISTAKRNARLNKIDNVKSRGGDVKRWKSRRKIDIVTANLFSELLIEILPKLKVARWLILSGILHDQERDVIRALKRNKIDIVQARRRGKWVAVLAAVK